MTLPSTGEDNVAPPAKEYIVISEIERGQRAGLPRKNMVKLMKKNAQKVTGGKYQL